MSSISAYASFERDGYGEEAALWPAPEPLPEVLDMALYGPLEAGCEAVVRTGYGERATIVRPGLIVGPHDPTDRFTYWLARVARGGAVLAPDRPGRTVQLIDVRDLARWMIGLVEGNVTGTFNATGPRAPLAMWEVLEACRTVSGSDARFEWIDDARLVEAGVAPWSELPLWIPESDRAKGAMMGASIARALASGLALRPLAETIADTLAWSRTRPANHFWMAGLDAQRERDLLASG